MQYSIRTRLFTGLFILILISSTAFLTGCDSGGSVPEGDLEITDLDGGTGPVAEIGQAILVSYTGKLSDGSIFDSSDSSDTTDVPLSFTLGAGQVLQGWDEGIPGMKEGGTRRLKIPPGKAYGRNGVPDLVPGNETVTFDITLDAILTDVFVRDLKVGDGATVAVGDTVSVDYVGTLTNGQVFDASSFAGRPFQFVVGGGQVIPGWDRGIVGMKVGGRRMLIIPSGLAYGLTGIGSIPPLAVLTFVIDLRSIDTL